MPLDARVLRHAAFLAGGAGALLLLAAAAAGSRSPALETLLAVGILAYLALHVHLLAGGRATFRVAAAMIVRGWQVFLSYRFQVAVMLLQLFLLVGLVFLLGRPVVRALFVPVGSAMASYTATNYVVFLLLGIAAWPILWGAYEVSSLRIRQEQWTGLFEVLAATHAGVETLPFAYLAGSLAGSLLGLTGTLLVLRFLLPAGALHVGEPAVLLAFAVVLALSLVTMWGLGLVIGGLTTLFKEAGPVSNVLRFALIAFAGIYVPVEVLPAWASPVSRVLPLTYTFDAVRAVLGGGASILDVFPEVAVLGAFAVGASVGGMLIFRWLLMKARRAGTLYGY